MVDSRFTELFTRYSAGTATEAEVAEYYALVRTGSHDEELEALLRLHWRGLPQDVQYFDSAVRERMLENIIGTQVQKRIQAFYWIKRVSAVAAVLVLVIGGYFYLKPTTPISTEESIAKMQDIAPGHAGAVITLSDGRKFALDTAKDGLLAVDGTVKIYKENGQIKYVGQTAQVLYNETSTDRGRSWPVQLPDGTTVWLNTSSSIRYPLAFTGKERRVQMKGECFFEVVHNDRMPFRVELPSGAVVEDVGTAFNIRAYADEATTRTTVTEGVANISTDATKYIIAAGRQAVSDERGITKILPATNMEEITAWKDNRFRFSNASVQTILKEAARWYDMEVVYEGEIKEAYFISMSRSVPLSRLLHDLEQSGGVHFKIDGNKVTVTR